MTSTQPCHTELIADDPSDKDEFGLSHKRVADAIADLIKQPDGGKSIGLEGGWGSGKTTIVRLVSGQFAADKNYLFFMFDAWAHEGDPLRRTFLESLIDQLHEAGWLTDWTVWEEQKEIIAQRKEIKETDTRPYITWIGILVIFSVALIPIGIAILNAALRDTPNLTIDWHSFINKKFLLGLTLTMAPVIAVFFGLIVSGLASLSVSLFRRLFGSKTSQALTAGKRRRKKVGASFLWAMLINKAITSERTETNKTNNPTSVEFEAKFSELMKDALAVKERRLILVLDNLDRISAAEALKIWSTLQTFLRPLSTPKAEWIKQLWVLMPYDSEGIAALWSKPKAQSEGKQEAATAPDDSAAQPAREPKDAAGRNDNAVALSFLDKSFQLRFEVPPPVLSNWRQYLLKLCATAFEGHFKRNGNEDFHNPYRLYVWYLNKTNQLPNPRQLKLYVNQIGALHRQWKDTYPLSHMAYYVLLRRLNINVVKMVLDGKLPEREVEGLLDPNAAENLAALVFNTDVDTAKQIVLSNPIKEAFEIRSVERLREIFDKHQDKGFWEALDNLDSDSFSSQLLGNAAYCLSKLNILSKDHQTVERLADIQSIIRTLRRNARLKQDWALVNTDTAKNISALGNIVAEEQFLIELLKNLSANFSPIGEQSQSSDVTAWAVAVRELYEALTPNLRDTYLQGIIEPLATRVRRQDDREIPQLLEALSELSHWHDAVKQSLVELATDGTIEQQVTKQVQRTAESDPLSPDWFQSMAWELRILLELNISAIPPTVLTLRKSHSQATEAVRDDLFFLAGTLTELLLRDKKIDLLFELYNWNQISESLVINGLRIASENDQAISHFNAENITNNWPLFKQLRKDDAGKPAYNQLISRLIKETSFATDVSRTAFNPELARLYGTMALHGAVSNDDFSNWLIRGLQSIPQEHWLSSLQNDGDLFNLLLSIPSLLQKFSLPANQNALVEYAGQLLTGKETTSPWPEGRQLIGYSSGSESERDALRKRLYELALSANGEISRAFFKLFGEEILYPEITDDRIFIHLFEPMIQKGDEYALQWLEAIIKYNLDSLQSYTIAYDQFKNWLRSNLPSYPYAGRFLEIVETTSELAE